MLLPALVLAFACLRAAEFGAAWPAGIDATAAAWCIARAVADDALTLLRYLPLLFLGSLPLLLSTSPRRRLWGVGLAWSVLVLAQTALLEYFVTARVPLGADLSAYSAAEIRSAVSSSAGINPWIGTGTLIALACLWIALMRRARVTGWRPAPRITAILCTVGLAALIFGPAELPPAHGEAEYVRTLRLSKAAIFLDGNIGYARLALIGSAARIVAPAAPHYPFLHVERTPDVLGPAFDVDPSARPNFVFVIVEGLGRSFSGPEAPLGSFTPFLDELAERSLYWDNFLASQGRTFAILPSLFGSLPFAEQGFAALGQRMPQHTTLLSVLTSAGYKLRFFSGFDAAFDDERPFLERQGVDTLVDRASFGPGYPRTDQWRYDDAELVSLALSAEARDDREPFVDIIQTITMHDPYRFSGEERYRAEVEARLDRLGIADAQRAPYRAYRDIYASILYADDALRRYFDEASKRRSYHNTIFIVTGDHRLPELPLSEWIDRYHVPLLVYSPLLKAPRRIHSVSSHLDVAPSLLALLANGYGIRTPDLVAWVGSGLDMEPSFRNIHDIPIKQTKVNLVDFVSGEWLLSRDALYRLRDGLHMEPARDAPAEARVRGRFAAYLAANAQFAASLRLLPSGAAAQGSAYAARAHDSVAGAPIAASGTLAVRSASAPERARQGQLAIDVEFMNGTAEPRGPFVPLVVLSRVDGTEVSESYGRPSTLAAGQALTVHLAVRTAGVTPGRYFLSVFPSDPATGKRTGDGRFHIPLVIEQAGAPAPP